VEIAVPLAYGLRLISSIASAGVSTRTGPEDLVTVDRHVSASWDRLRTCSAPTRRHVATVSLIERKNGGEIVRIRKTERKVLSALSVAKAN
jgi:hypothetical protein